MAPTDSRPISPLANIIPTSSPEPAAIEIVGIVCRFPGGMDSPATYWDFLMAGGDGDRHRRKGPPSPRTAIRTGSPYLTAKAAEAHRAISGRHTTGKVVLIT
jgi:Beta-ketoacyl synthase, N-terminal domain